MQERIGSVLIKNYSDDDQDFEYEVSDEEADVLIRFAIIKLVEIGWIDLENSEYKIFGTLDNEGGTLQ
jgi:hypothetical protein